MQPIYEAGTEWSEIQLERSKNIDLESLLTKDAVMKLVDEIFSKEWRRGQELLLIVRVAPTQKAETTYAGHPFRGYQARAAGFGTAGPFYDLEIDLNRLMR